MTPYHIARRIFYLSEPEVIHEFGIEEGTNIRKYLKIIKNRSQSKRKYKTKTLITKILIWKEL